MAQTARGVKNVSTMLFLIQLFLLTLGLSLGAWVLVDWLRERWLIRERRARSREAHPTSEGSRQSVPPSHIVASADDSFRKVSRPHRPLGGNLAAVEE